jgi:uncharacterized delta-60 repeat protein
MATNRLFAFNNGPAIGDALQYGNLSISDYPISGYRWWPGPDEDIGYIIAHDDANPNMRTEGSRSATVSTNSVGFWRTSKTDVDFLLTFNDLFSKSYSSAPNAAYWLNTNGYWTSYSPEEPLISQIFVGGGSFSAYNGTSVNGFVKLNIDGTIDNTFSVGTGFDLTGNQDAIQTVSVQDDGKILVGGSFNSYNGTTASNLIRLNTDGTVDNTFNNTSFGTIITTKIQPDGKILVGGSFNFSYNGSQIAVLTRLNTDGTFDNTFVQNWDTYLQALENYNPIKSPGIPYDIVLQPNGKIIVGGIQGRVENYSGDIGIVNPDGSIDNTTTTKIYPTEGYVFAVDLQTDGKILMGGNFITYGSSTPGVFYNRNRLVRLNSDLTIDDTFNIGTGFDAVVYSIKVQYDGKIVVGGNFTSYNGTSCNNIIRLNSDGSIDTTFNIGTGFARTGLSSGTVNDLKIQADGKIIVIGYFNSYNGTSCNGIARLNLDGSFDSGFTIGTGLNFTLGYPPQTIG